MILELVTQGQQLHAIAAQLAGHPRRRGSLGESAEDQEDHRGGSAGLVQGGVGEGIEDAAAILTAVVDDRDAVLAMNTQVLTAAAGAGYSGSRLSCTQAGMLKPTENVLRRDPA